MAIDFMMERLKAMKKRLEDIDKLLTEGTLDIPTMTKLSKERANLEDPVTMYDELIKMINDRNDAEVMLKDEDDEIREMAKMTFDELGPQIEKREKKSKSLFFQKMKMMIKTSSWKSVVQLVAMKLTFSLVTYLECILTMLIVKDGRLKF